MADIERYHKTKTSSHAVGSSFIPLSTYNDQFLINGIDLAHAKVTSYTPVLHLDAVALTVAVGGLPLFRSSARKC